jgi:hypothetical protein
MQSATACDALKNGVCLEIRYDGFTRDVEVHAVGISTAGHPVMRIWQVRGGSVHNEPIGWKLLRVDEAIGLALLAEQSNAPRPGYKRGDKGMTTILCQL